MSKSTRLWFSTDHKSSSNPTRHVDNYRKNSNSSKTQKTGHSFSSPGYLSSSKSIKVRKGR
jgi:hypothetical protein